MVVTDEGDTDRDRVEYEREGFWASTTNKQLNGCVANPLGIEGVVVGEGDTYEEALYDVRSALASQLLGVSWVRG
jgi:hypothetical protein